jgi:hypothetical protein
MRTKIAALAFLALAAPAEAQTVTGTILGAVSDTSGARVAGAAVTAINELTQEKHSTASNAMGDYLLIALPVGNYRVEMESQGFKKFVHRGVVLELNQNARVDAALELGAVSQEVVVQGNAASVDTHQVQLGTVVDTQRINDLPLNGRNVYSLVTQLPGVTGTTLQAQPDVAQGNQMNLNGARTLQTSFLLDGGLNNNVWRDGGLMSPNPDAVEEFRLITSNYNAEYGRSGGGIVNVITKSGTNRFHGTLYEYLRNDDLDARSFFNPSVSILKQNQFGGTLGGPVKHDKLFFFFSNEGTRQRAGQFVNTARTPTAAQRGGNFAGLPAAQSPRDPDTNTLFPGGIIPTSRLDPVAQNMLNAIVPLPNTPDGRVQGSASQALTNNQYLAKGDYLLSPTHKITVSTFTVRSNLYAPFAGGGNLPGYAPATTTAHQNNVTATDTCTISPSLLNQALFNFTHAHSLQDDVNHVGLTQWGSKFTLVAEPLRPPRITVTNGWTGGTFGDVDETDEVYTIGNTLSWMRGSHSVKAGGTFQHFVYDYDSNGSASGLITDTGAFTGNSFSDLELGHLGLTVTAPFTPHLRMNDWALFAQDDWKISRKVTLNLGVRYDVFHPFTSISGQLSNWNFGQQSVKFPAAPLGMTFVGDPGVPDGLIPTRYKNFAPRVGIAYDPFGNGKTAIRAGYGIFYSIGFAGLYNIDYGQPFQPSANILQTPGLVNPLAGLNVPFPPPPGVVQFTLPINVPWMNQNNTTPYLHQYNFTVQRQLMQNLSLDVAYVGNGARHLQQQRDANAPIFHAGTSTAANVNARRPIEPNVVAQLQEAETASNSNYNALQVTLNRRFAHGLTALANFTHAKAIDMQSADQQGPGITFTDNGNLRLDRGPSSFDVRNVFNLTFLWEPPKTAKFGFIGKQILSNWQINGITRYTSGRAFTVTSGVDTNLDGNNVDRPNLAGDPNLPTGRSRSVMLKQYFLPSAFQTPATGLNGTAGRDILYGPGFANWDLSFFKNIPIHESHRLQFRAEFFNIFNKPNFNPPVAVLNNPNVGVILGAGAGRVIQFGLKYSF